MSVVDSLRVSSCDIPFEFLVEDTFITDAPEFETTTVIRWLHEKTLRLGYSRDLSEAILMTNREEQQHQQQQQQLPWTSNNDYEAGLIATSSVMIGRFVFWSLLLLLFKKMGPERVGILSGSSPLVANTPPRRKKVFRGIFHFAGLSIIICSILMSVYGVGSLTETISTGRGTLDVVQNQIYEGIELLDMVIKENTVSDAAAQSFLATFTHNCPNFQAALLLCDDDDSNSSNNNGGNSSSTFPPSCELGNSLGRENLNSIQTMLNYFEGGQDSLHHQELRQLRDDLAYLAIVTEKADEKATNFNWVVYCTTAFSITLSLICSYMMVGECYRSSKLLQSLRSQLVIPLYVLCVTCCVFFSSLFIRWSMMLADLCVDGPDDRLLLILNRFQEDLSPILVESATFYTSHCPADEMPSGLTSIIETVVDTVPYVERFRSVIYFNKEVVEEFCGLEDLAPLMDISTTVTSHLCNGMEVLNRARLYFQCENWHPLYEATVYDTMCHDGSSGLAWMASTQFIIVVMSMILLTLRGFLYNDDNLINGTVVAEKDVSGQSAWSETKDTILPSSTNNAIEVWPASPKCVGKK